MTIIDTYLAKLPKDKQQVLLRIREITKKVVPESEESISYGMPTLKYQGISFLGFNLHKNHIGIYPYGGEEIALVADKLKQLGFGFSSGAIRVPFDREFPENLLREIIQHRISRIRRK